MCINYFLLAHLTIYLSFPDSRAISVILVYRLKYKTVIYTISTFTLV